MRGGKDGTVYNGKDICIVIGKSVAANQQDEIACQEGSDEIGDVAVFHGQRNDSSGAITERQTLHDTQNTDAVECPYGFP